MVTAELTWLRRCAAGEPAACRELVNRYARMVGTIILRALGRSDGVEDLVQETFLKVFRALPEYEGRAKLSTWMCTIAHRVAMDELRRMRRQLPTAPVEVFDEDIGLQDGPDLEAALSQEQRDALVRQALAALPDKYRLPLIYAAIEELDYDTIAAMLSLPLGTIKTNIHRGKALLRRHLADVLAEDADHD